ncbi:MAG: DUF4397 domain-containing protein [Thermomicrobiales bacterium]|nr:DUF4397 domain-containing protein [Thermomicrobiales bacterium]
MTRNRRRVRLTGALVAIAALLLTMLPMPALGQSATPVAVPMASPVANAVPCTTLFGIAAGNACVLFLNGSADAGPVDLYVDGTLATFGAGFGILNEFVPVSAGERRLQIVPSGGALDTAIVDDRVNLQEGVAYTISALGPVQQVRASVLPLDTSPLPQGDARIRVVNGSADAPALDLAITGGAPLVNNLAPGAVSNTRDLPAGTYQLEVRRAGATDVLLPLPGTVLSPDYSYTIFMIGSIAGGTFGATIVPVYVTPVVAASATPVG